MHPTEIVNTQVGKFTPKRQNLHPTGKILHPTEKIYTQLEKIYTHLTKFTPNKQIVPQINFIFYKEIISILTLKAELN